MKRITTSVKHVVPNWNFCNSDNLLYGELTKEKCRFCVKQKDGYHCMLHDESLNLRNGFVSKTDACCKATAGRNVTAVQKDDIAIDPTKVMKQAVDLYIKQYADLISQGYPPAIARTVARDYVIGK